MAVGDSNDFTLKNPRGTTKLALVFTSGTGESDQATFDVEVTFVYCARKCNTCTPHIICEFCCVNCLVIPHQIMRRLTKILKDELLAVTRLEKFLFW